QGCAAFDALALYALLHREVGRVKAQSGYLQRGVPPEAFDHPVQGDIREAVVGVGTADVGVHAGEPYLFDDLPRRQWLVDGLLPQGGWEGAALLVDGQGVEGDVDMRAQVHI